MAGLKQSIFNDNPVSFWTFDLDQNLVNGDQIIDEIGNANPMICQDDVNGTNYTLEAQSLNLLETSDQASIRIAENQKVNGLWLNQYFEVVNTTSYNFPNQGQFSIEFLYYKDFADDIRDNGEIGQFGIIETPLIRKGSIIDIKLQDYYSSSLDKLSVTILGRTIVVNHFTDYPVFSRTNHVVVTYSIDQIDVNEYTSTIQVWVNGRLWGEDVETHIDNTPDTSTTASWLFAGNGGNDPLTDYATELLILDQIAVYQYPLTTQQISNHYRKTKQYADMLIDDIPTHYWRLNDSAIPTDLTIYPEVGSVDGTYIGSVNRFQPGPDRLIGTNSSFFQSGGAGYIDSVISNQFQPILDTSDSYSMEFWFNCGSNNRGMLIDCTEEQPNEWNGIRVYLNSKSNAHSPGNLQFSQSSSVFINSLDVDGSGDRYNFNDELWHHVCVIFDNPTSTYSLYIDGVLHGTTVATTSAIGKPGQITLMNARPGDMALNGFMCELAFYGYTLQESQIYNRWVFSTRYKVGGYTLLQGAPVQALVRFYDTITGELNGEVISDGTTGEYVYYPLDNRYLDVLSRVLNSSTTRYRVHGPVKPAEYDDSHLQ